MRKWWRGWRDIDCGSTGGEGTGGDTGGDPEVQPEGIESYSWQVLLMDLQYGRSQLHPKRGQYC